MVGVSEEYVDNFNRTQQNPQSNYRSTVAPGLQVLMDYGFLTGSASYTLNAFHDSLVKEIGFNHSLAGVLTWQVTPRFRLSLAEAYLESDNPGQADRLQINQTRERFSSNQISLTGDYSFLEMLDMRGYYRRSDFTGQAAKTESSTTGFSASKTLDRIHVVTAGYEYLTSETTFTGTGATTAGTAVAAAGTANNSTLTGHQFTGSFSRDLTATTTAGISGAYAMRDQQASTGNSSFSRWNLSFFSNYVLQDKLILRSDIGVAQLTTDSTTGSPLLTSTSSASYWFGPAVASVGIERGFAETFGQGQNLGTVQTSAYTASLLYRFTPLVSGQINGTYRENESTGTGGGVAGNSTKVYTVGVNFTYQILRWLTASVEALHTNSQGTGQGQTSFTENKVRASLNAILY